MTWYRLERGQSAVPASAVAAMSEKAAAIRDAQRCGTGPALGHRDAAGSYGRDRVTPRAWHAAVSVT